MSFPSFFMKPIERVRATTSIIEAMWNEMSIDDVNLFFRRMELDAPKNSSGFNQRDLTRYYLGQCDDAALLDIANQLGLDDIQPSSSVGLVESTYWLTDHFRVFISHVHTVKTNAHNLKGILRSYGISAFVAHDDIKVSAKWRDEILKSLHSMDACVAILTEDFTTSKWTDQEIGLAICRDVLIVPIHKGVMPYGFIEELQAIKSSGMKTGEVAAKVFEAICDSPKTKVRMIECLAKTIATSPDDKIASFRVAKLAQIGGVSSSAWMTVRQNVAANPTLMEARSFVNQLNDQLKSAGIQQLSKGTPEKKAIDDEIPF